MAGPLPDLHRRRGRGFLEGARRAAEEIPAAELLVLEEAHHYAAHMSHDEVLIGAALGTLRRCA